MKQKLLTDCGITAGLRLSQERRNEKKKLPVASEDAGELKKRVFGNTTNITLQLLSGVMAEHILVKLPNLIEARISEFCHQRLPGILAYILDESFQNQAEAADIDADSMSGITPDELSKRHSQLTESDQKLEADLVRLRGTVEAIQFSK